MVLMDAQHTDGRAAFAPSYDGLTAGARLDRPSGGQPPAEGAHGQDAQRHQPAGAVARDGQGEDTNDRVDEHRH